MRPGTLNVPAEPLLRSAAIIWPIASNTALTSFLEIPACSAMTAMTSDLLRGLPLAPVMRPALRAAGAACLAVDLRAGALRVVALRAAAFLPAVLRAVFF